MSEQSSVSQEKLNCNAVAAKALANSMGSSGAGMTLLSHFELRSEGQVSVHHMEQLHEVSACCEWRGFG